MFSPVACDGGILIATHGPGNVACDGGILIAASRTPWQSQPQIKNAPTCSKMHFAEYLLFALQTVESQLYFQFEERTFWH